MTVSNLTPHPHGVTAVDAHYLRAGLDAIHVIAHQGRAAIVDSGTSLSVPHLLVALERLGIARDAVDWLFLTHVHLDHAGGAGALMRELPRAQAVLHPRGAAHLVDPSVLVAGTIGVYGEATYRALYGEIVPIDAARVRVTSDGERLELGRARVRVPAHAGPRAASPGHRRPRRARRVHRRHLRRVLPRVRRRRARLRDPDDDADAVRPRAAGRLDRRIAALRPEAVYLTHYSRVTDVPRLAESLERQVRHLAQLALAHAGSPEAAPAIRTGLREAWLAQVREHGCPMGEAQVDALLRGDLDLNVDGVLAWLARRRPAAAVTRAGARVTGRGDATTLTRTPLDPHEEHR